MLDSLLRSLYTMMYFTRIKEWIYIVGLVLLGFFYGGIKNFNFSQFFVLLVISFLYLSHGYSMNNCCDFKIDSKAKNPISSGELTFRKGLLISHFLFLFNCLISFLFSKVIFLLVVIGWVLSILYSAPPFRFKYRLIPNLLLNSLGFSILFMIGFLANKSVVLEMWLLVVLIFLTVMSAQTIHLVSHRREYKHFYIYRKYLIFLFCFLLSSLVTWSFVLWLFFSFTKVLFILTLLFSLIQLHLFNTYKETNLEKLRFKIRMANISYGICLLLVFVMM